VDIIHVKNIIFPGEDYTDVERSDYLGELEFELWRRVGGEEETRPHSFSLSVCLSVCLALLSGCQDVQIYKRSRVIIDTYV
jgi:hypothetical protein